MWLKPKKTDSERKDTEQFIRDYLEKEGWDTIYKLSVSRDKTEHLIEAAIDKDSWLIDFKLDPDFEKEIDNIVEKERKAGIKIDTIGAAGTVPKQDGAMAANGVSSVVPSTPQEKLAYSSARHEKGHWEACPRDTAFFESILDGISRGLKSAGFEKEKIEEYTPHVANMFMDIVVNADGAIGSDDRDFAEGMELFYTKEAYVGGNHGVFGGPHFPDYYSLFVDSQMSIYGDAEMGRKLGRRFSKDYDKLRYVSKEIVRVLTDSKIAEKSFAGALDVADKKSALELLMDRGKWHEKSEGFAKLMAGYVKDNIEDMQKRVDQSPFTKKMGSGGNERRRKCGGGCGKGKQESGRGGTGGTRGGKDDGSDDFRRELIRHGIARGSELMWADGFDVYDEIYKQAANEIVMDFLKKDGEENPRFPLFYMKRSLVKEGDGMENMDWAKTIFVKGDVLLYKKDVPYELETEGLSGTGSCEDLLMILDATGSMDWSGQPLDGSKYDMLLRSVYSAFDHLEKTGKAIYLRYGLIMFRDRGETTWSGWKAYNELDDLKRLMFEGYRGSDETVLDADKVEEAYSSRADNFLTLMVSDGEIHNRADALNSCKKIMDGGNDFVLFQVMERSTFAEYMKRYGAVVVDVDKPEDLAGLVLRKVDMKYSPDRGGN